LASAEVQACLLLGASPATRGSGFAGLRYRSGHAVGVAASHPSNPLRSYRVWVAPQAQPHSGKPLRGLCSALAYRKRALGALPRSGFKTRWRVQACLPYAADGRCQPRMPIGLAVLNATNKPKFAPGMLPRSGLGCRRACVTFFLYFFRYNV
jgi:hypothetical protein